MHPAFSVIFLTTLIGVGQGLFLALFTAQSYSVFGLLPAQDGATFYAPGSLLALAFLGGGLVASFFHLGHPERAWRAASQWRTSWLSREVIVLPVFIGAVAAYAASHWFGWRPVVASLPSGVAVDASLALGTAASLLAFALFGCTAMIYACLRFLREWHSPLTVVNYVLLGGASGFSLAAWFADAAAPALEGFFAGWALILTALGLITRSAALWRNARLPQRSNLQTAIGVKHPQIAQKAQGFTGGSFNTREYFHGRTPAFLRRLRWAFLLAAFVAPLLLLAAGQSAAAFLVQYAGLLAERWCFFAEARHPQNLYYQSAA